MPAEIKQPQTVPDFGIQRIDEEERQRKMKKLQERIDAKRDEMYKCLDADYAAQVEARKPVYEYKVSCQVSVVEKGRRTTKKLEETVRGKNEDDAWAHFCDAVQHWPPPRGCGRKIVKLNKKD